ncbi:DUF1668 domain-containing protein [Endozoicomonas sp. YOMI1]|uniref:DUF1668 domain-containing protein n=1 Tax=Endozoicomonas sp. YOMI1 TaxID=2828739 RepID=UPI002148276C|nr:DUF1668 domain-containing protein [Endozoicomonas sp. YOMI1]
MNDDGRYYGKGESVSIGEKVFIQTGGKGIALSLAQYEVEVLDNQDARLFRRTYWWHPNSPPF